MGRDMDDALIDCGPEAVAAAILTAQAPAPEPAAPTAAETVEAAILATLAGDAGALFEPDALDALRALDAPQWARTRARIKAECRDVSVRALDDALRAGAVAQAAEESSVADELVALVQTTAELLHTAEGDAYAHIQQGEGSQRHAETWALYSAGFREWLAATYYRQTGKAAREASLKDAVNALAGIAKHDGAEAVVWLRVAEHDGRHYLDLCDPLWRAIEIGPDGWQVLDHPPVLFRRTQTMRPLPEPVAGGNLDRLWPLVNIPEPGRVLVLAWLLETLRPGTPFPVLEIIGEQGSGKSDTCERLRRLTDPNAVNLRAAPKTVEDLFVGARNNWLCTLNNLSHLSAATQDAVCTLATGGGFAGRTLFTNVEETVFETTRPVLLNGISSLATAQDLVDRTIRIELPLIAEDRRALASDMAAQFEAEAGAVFGALLGLFADTLRALPRVRLDRSPRMADFARLGEAMTTARGWPSFAGTYAEHRERAIVAALEASPVAVAVQHYIDRHPSGWSGTVQGLLTVLAGFRHDAEAWPKSARGLADALRRLAPGLRVAGVAVEFNPVRQRDGFHVTVKMRTGGGMYARGENSTRDQIHDVHNVHKAAAPEVF